MLPSFCRDEVEVWRAPLVTERGKQVRDWQGAAMHPVAGCSVQRASTDGTWGLPRSGATVRMTLWMPPGADIEFGDKVVADGREYALDGEPLPWRSPTGAVSHLVADLVDWRG